MKNRSHFLLIVALFIVYSCAPSDNCIHRWPLDEGPGSKTVKDVVDSANGLVQGARLGLPGKIQTSAGFNGESEYIISDIADGTLPRYTVALWVKASSLGQSNYTGILNNKNNGGNESDLRDSFQIDVDGGNPGNYRIFFESSGVVFGVVTMEWQHLAVTYDGQTIKTYVDGAQKNSLSLAPGLAGTNFRDVVLGRNRRGNQYFDGSIDDVVIYNKPLSPNEIADLATGTAAGSCGQPSAK